MGGEEVKGLCVQLRIDDDPQLLLSKQHLEVALNIPYTFDGIFLSFQCSRFLVVVVLFIIILVLLFHADFGSYQFALGAFQRWLCY